MNNIFLVLLVTVFAFTLTSCASTKVERVPVGERVDISGGFNDYDATTAAKLLISDCLSGGWLANFTAANTNNPVILVSHVANRTSEHINTQVITKSLEKSLLDSGKVDFVAASDERNFLREEREDQQKGFTDPATMAALGKEIGANFLLIGSVNSITDALEKKSAVYYQINLELLNLTTNQKVWIGQEEIKKVVTRRKYGL